jgi:phage baseplate assembly protein W
MRNPLNNDDQKAWLGRGWAYPVLPDSRTGDVAVAQYEDDIRQSIRIILGTARGERVMRADFGCGIHDLVFDSPDTAMVTRIETTVRESISRYEARVEVLEVSVDTSQFLRGQLIVQLEYRVRKTNQRDNLVYPFYFREGGRGIGAGPRDGREPA